MGGSACGWCHLDGTQDRPGKTAQNWSRRDNIRAGAVSGPWRSVPRAGGEAPAVSVPVAGPVQRPEPVAATPVQDGPKAAHGAMRASQTRTMVVWIGAGVLAAFAIVGAAVLFQPGEKVVGAMPTETAGLEAAAPAPVTAPEAAPAVAEGTADPALSGVKSVRLRIGPAVPAGQRESIVGALAAAGVTDVVVESLPFRIATSRVGYYRAADEPAAQALARVASPLIGNGASIGVRDYGKLLTDPQPGRLDLWIGG